MRKLLRICFYLFTGALVFFASTADMSFMKQFHYHMDLALYLRIASLLALLIVLYWAWGYKKSIEISHKYKRADEMLRSAEQNSLRKQEAARQLEVTLAANYDEKEKKLADKMARFERELERKAREHTQRIQELTQQNMALKETVSQLMEIARNHKK